MRMSIGTAYSIELLEFCYGFCCRTLESAKGRCRKVKGAKAMTLDAEDNPKALDAEVRIADGESRVYEMRLAVLRACQVLSFDLVHLLCTGYQVRYQETGYRNVIMTSYSGPSMQEGA